MKRFSCFLVLCNIAIASGVIGCEYDFYVNEWVVDFKRPTVDLGKHAKRKTPFNIPQENRKAALLVNGQYPGPLVECDLNDTIKVNVHNDLIAEGITIHWHGVHPHTQPYMDGTLGVSQAAILPGTNFTYEYKAWPVGTHYWHAHMDGMASAKGVRGALIIRDKQNVKLEEDLEEKLLIVGGSRQ